MLYRKHNAREKHKHRNVVEHAFMEMEMYVDQIGIIGNVFLFYAVKLKTSKKKNIPDAFP